MSKQKLTLYQQHKQKWSNGCGHACCDAATKVVLCRGKIPCDILLVGQSPGKSEDVLGKPFVGPAGQLLDHIVNKALIDRSDLRTAFTNIVGCIPRDEEGEVANDPTDEQMKSCKSRLEEFLRIARPKVIVCVGKVAKGWMEQGYLHSVLLPKPKPHLIDIWHPSYIIQSPIAGQSLLIDECIIIIEDAVEKYLKEKE